MQFASCLGETLTEVLVALFLLGINVLLISHALFIGHHQTKESYFDNQAKLLVHHVMESASEKEGLTQEQIQFWEATIHDQLPGSEVVWQKQPPFISELSWRTPNLKKIQPSDLN